jgi:RimJ/RimL family protein N-acetyltransferase
MNQNPVPEEITYADFKCPHCGNPVSFPDRWIGLAQECPTCCQILIVPKNGAEMGLKLPLPIETPRLLLRRLAPVDSKDLLEIVADEDSFRYLEWNPLDVQEVENWLVSDRSTRLFQDEHNFCLAFELLEEPKVIGYIALVYRDADNRQMGFHAMVNRRYRCRGFAAEGIRAAMQFAFAGLNIHRLSNRCDCRNIAAVRMLEKAGFRREAHCIKARFQKGEWIDFYLYALLQEEYVSAASNEGSPVKP